MPPPPPPLHLPLHPSYYNNVLLPAWGEVSYESRERCLGAFYVGEMLGWEGVCGGGGGWRVTWDNSGTGVRASISKPTPYIPGLWKNGPIHILYLPKCWPIHILPFDVLYSFIAGSWTNIAVSSSNTKTSSPAKSLSEKYTHITECQKVAPFTS